MDQPPETTTTTPSSSSSAPSIASPTLLCGATAKPIRQAHKERCFDLDFSSCGRFLASASEDNEVRIWDVSSSPTTPEAPPAALVQVLSHSSEVLRVAWNQSSSNNNNGTTTRTLATGTATGLVRLFDISTTESLSSTTDDGDADSPPPPGAVTAKLVSDIRHPQGAGGEDSQIYALHWIDAHEDHDKPSSLLMAAADDKVYFWDVEKSEMANKWEFAAGSEDESTFGGPNRNPDGVCYVFDAAVGRLHQGETNDVVCLALSDGSMRILDRRSARAVATLRQRGAGHLTALHLNTEEGLLLACGGKGDTTVYDARTFSVRAVLEGHARPCFGARVLPRDLTEEHFPTASGGPVILTWSTDCTLRLVDLDAAGGGGKPLLLETVHHPDFPIYTAAFSPVPVGSEGKGKGKKRQLVLGGGEGQQAAHDHDHDHDHDHEHDHEGCGHAGCGSEHETDASCCKGEAECVEEHASHDCGSHHHHHHHHQQQVEEEDESLGEATSLLMYSFPF